MNRQFAPGDVVLGSWKLTKLIGEGSFGKVYLAEREDFGIRYEAAVKIITIPQSQSEVKSAMAEGMDSGSVTAYFRGFVQELVQEIALMSQLKGTANVVSYEDHMVIPHENGVGWDIVIRMELLTPLLDHMAAHTMTRHDVIRLGIDLCKALELCQKYNIIHRDIKPENIFISRTGDYKLGDFGIARTAEKTTGGMSKKGTYTYMAPEVYRGSAYGSGVDLYSLGLVLYRLLNESRAPFLPPYPAPITHTDRETALTRRMGGEPLPAPKNAEGRLGEIVLKACAYDPKDRYSSPMQMRQELEAILYNRAEGPMIYPGGDEVPAKSLREVSVGEPAPAPAEQPAEPEKTESIFDTPPVTAPAAPEREKTESIFEAPPTVPEKKPVNGGNEPPAPKKRSKAPLIIGILLLVLALAAGAWYFLLRDDDSGRSKDQDRDKSSSIRDDKDESETDAASANDGIIRIGVYAARDVTSERYFEILEYVSEHFPTADINGKSVPVELVYGYVEGNGEGAEEAVALFKRASCAAILNLHTLTSDAVIPSLTEQLLAVGSRCPVLSLSDLPEAYTYENWFSFGHYRVNDGALTAIYALEQLGSTAYVRSGLDLMSFQQEFEARGGTVVSYPENADLIYFDGLSSDVDISELLQYNIPIIDAYWSSVDGELPKDRELIHYPDSSVKIQQHRDALGNWDWYFFNEMRVYDMYQMVCAAASRKFLEDISMADALRTMTWDGCSGYYTCSADSGIMENHALSFHTEGGMLTYTLKPEEESPAIDASASDDAAADPSVSADLPREHHPLTDAEIEDKVTQLRSWFTEIETGGNWETYALGDQGEARIQNGELTRITWYPDAEHPYYTYCYYHDTHLFFIYTVDEGDGGEGRLYFDTEYATPIRWIDEHGELYNFEMGISTVFPVDCALAQDIYDQYRQEIESVHRDTILELGLF